MVIRITQATSSAYLHPIIKFFSSLIFAFNYFFLLIHELLPPNTVCPVAYPTNNIQGHYAGMLYLLLLEMDLQEIRTDPLNIDRDSLIDRLARIRGGGRGVGGNGGGGCVRRRDD